MNAAGMAEAIAFAVSAFIAVVGALGMATTMSMFRSGIFLMASFMGVAGLFILLSADLLGLLQIMMYIGGMLVMILFMVLFMQDPGGAMMADMPDMMTPVGKIFSLGLAQNDPSGTGPEKADEEDDTGDMDMSDMAMVTPAHGWALGVALLTAGGLVALLLLRPAWKLAAVAPDPRSAERIGSLLMDKYMVGFEGAGFLILIGIVGAVFMARTGRHGVKADRDSRSAIEDEPPEMEADPLVPSTGIGEKPQGDAA